MSQIYTDVFEIDRDGWEQTGVEKLSSFKKKKNLSNLFWNRNLGKSHEEYSCLYGLGPKCLLDLCSCDTFVKCTRQYVILFFKKGPHLCFNYASFMHPILIPKCRLVGVPQNLRMSPSGSRSKIAVNTQAFKLFNVAKCQNIPYFQ